MVRGGRGVFVLLTAVVVVACTASPGVRSTGAETASTPSPATTGPEPGETLPSGPSGDGLGDELFPALGNPGIDVDHYSLDLHYDPATDLIEATMTVALALTEQRPEVTLDAVGLLVDSVSVDGEDAEYAMEPEKVRVVLPAGSADDGEAEIAIGYQVDPSPTTSAVGLPSGWFDTAGGSYVLNEPDGARTWMPCNDHPSDKATYDITITVPTGLTGVANGELVEHRTEEGAEVWHWRESAPMATYLVLVLTGDYELVTGTGPHGVAIESAILREDIPVMQPFLDSIDDQIAFFEEWFGPYPFADYGIAMTDSDPGLAMENQGLSMFSRTDFGSGVLYETTEMLLSHELAHQWFGDAVTPARWIDIWLNESFATYGEWMWLDHVGIATLGSRAESALADRPPGSSARPPVTDLFGYNSYYGGAVVLHALRLTVGDEPFFEILRTWAREGFGASRTTDDFIATAEAVAGRDLGEFFATWLFADVPPQQYPAAPVGA